MTTIQTIKEAEERFENKFCYPKGHIMAGLPSVIPALGMTFNSTGSFLASCPSIP